MTLKIVMCWAGRARANKLAPHEFTGGSFTISNLGMFGIRDFSAIINPPQACIMAVGGTQQRTRSDSGLLVTESFMTVTLSADSRVVDEETAAEFLQSFAFQIENPALLLA
jgi:pyruvate dehydrogenase E2 component (dihydrolipoamide acetyltransferase)